MKEIKFRGMDLQGHWHHGLPTHIQTDKGSGYKRGWYISNSVGMPCAYPVRPDTVSQFIGLTDKNRKEIFVGDIANVDGREDPHLVEFLPKASGGRFQFTHPKKGVWSCFPEPSIEIIGNIYENPELLNSKQGRASS